MSIFSWKNRGNGSSRRPARFWLAILSVVALLLAAGAGFVAVRGVQHAHAASWTQVWGDDFNGASGSGVDTGNWLYDTGTGYGCNGCPSNWGTNEVDSLTSSTNNVYLDGNGHLAIRPVRSGNSWTSGRIETQRTDFQAPDGGILAVEASIQQPNVSGAAAAGYWPAFWMLGAPYRGNYLNWPAIGEIDIMEDINGLSSDFGTFHCGVYPSGPCNEGTGIGSGQRDCAGCQTAFHTYRMEYDRSVSPEQIRWYLDGNNFFTVSANQFSSDTWNAAVHHGFFVILDIAMGGNFPNAFGGGPTSATASGVPMLIDYVHVLTSAGSATPPPSGNTSFSTSFESGDPQPNWTNSVDNAGFPSGGLQNVVGVCCGLTGPEAGPRNETAHQGNTALMYSGSDNDGSTSYAYMQVFDLSSQNVTVSANSVLDYWIYPQSSSQNGLVSGSNSSCVALDLIFQDSNGNRSNLRDSGAIDQNGNRAHPAYQCNHLTLDSWNHVVVNLAAHSNGLQIVKIDVAYDQPGNTGGYRGYIDDVSIHN